MRSLLVIAVCLLTVSCAEDPAASVRIPPGVVVHAATKVPTPVKKFYRSPNGPYRDLLLDACPVPGEAPGPGSFSAEGTCGFRERELVDCESVKDDFIIAVTRPAQNGWTLVAYLNVERYHGPGEYDGAQLFVAVQNERTIYRWSSEDLHVRVEPYEEAATVSSGRLEAEPVHFQCSTLLTPESNLTYQCNAASESNFRFNKSDLKVKGTLQCREKRPVLVGRVD